MQFSRRQSLLLAAGAAATSALPRFAAALDYPVRPVRIFEGFGGGGTPDLVSRLIGQWLAERLGQPLGGEKPSRRRRKSRRRGGRHRGAGWLYAVDLPFGERGQRHAL